MYIQCFTTAVDLPEMRCLMEVSTLCFIFADTAFLLGGAEFL